MLVPVRRHWRSRRFANHCVSASDARLSRKSGDLEWKEVEGSEPASGRVDRNGTEADKIASEALAVRDPLGVVQEVAGSVQDASLVVDLHPLGVMRGVTEDEIEAAGIDEGVGEFP